MLAARVEENKGRVEKLRAQNVESLPMAGFCGAHRILETNYFTYKNCLAKTFSFKGCLLCPQGA